jgi:hypothetical protein
MQVRNLSEMDRLVVMAIDAMIHRSPDILREGENTMDFKQYIEALAGKLECILTPDGEEFKINVIHEDKRKQLITAYMYEEMEKKIIRLNTSVAKREHLSEKKLIALLELNASLVHGSFALSQNELILTCTILMESTEPEEAVPVVRYLAKMADSYEQMTTGLDRY